MAEGSNQFSIYFLLDPVINQGFNYRNVPIRNVTEHFNQILINNNLKFKRRFNDNNFQY
jgi:hypothetical protein